MAYVSELSEQDNLTPAAPTARLVAQRLGRTLTARFQNYIHKRECAPTQSDYEVKMASRALAAFSISYLADVDDVLAGQCVCDSSQDGGIDAICVNHAEKKIVIVQSKYNQAGNGTWTNADFLAFKHACELLQMSQYDRFDEILSNMSEDIEVGLNSIDYKILFVMTHTGKRGAANNILADMISWQRELNDAALIGSDIDNSQLPFQVHLVSAEDLTEWLQAGSNIKVDLNDVELDHYGLMSEPYQAFYGQISGDQVVDWWRVHGTKLFSKNIRNILGSTEVNESIKATAITNPELFWYFNNGVTLLVSEIEPHRRNSNRGTSRGTFKFSNASVINGAQTVSTLGEVFKNCDTQQDLIEKLRLIKVPARFIKVNDNDNTEIASLITRANNHQNRVLGRDFASQHVEQIRLARELVVEGYKYQLLRTDNQSVIMDENSIDLDEALNGLACLTLSPSVLATLKTQRGKFFDNLDGALYRQIFNPSVSGVKLINSVRHLRCIESLISSKLESIGRYENSKRHLIVTHGNRVFSAILLNKVCNIINANDVVVPDSNSISEKLDLVIGFAEEFIESNYSNAYPARFFGNVEKVTEIIGAITNNVDWRA